MVYGLKCDEAQASFESRAMNICLLSKFTISFALLDRRRAVTAHARAIQYV